MENKVNLHAHYIPSEDVIAREVEGELIIVPLFTDYDDELFSVNDTGKAIWEKLNSKKSLKAIIDELKITFDASNGQIERDVIEFVEELLKKRILIEAPAG